VIGEGVETDAALAALRSIGCDAAQGFLLASPMPAEQLRRWLDPVLNPLPVAGSTV
jgi:diguanylate cyclase